MRTHLQPTPIPTITSGPALSTHPTHHHRTNSISSRAVPRMYLSSRQAVHLGPQAVQGPLRYRRLHQQGRGVAPILHLLALVSRVVQRQVQHLHQVVA
jgi:hypothetical protein